MTFLSIVLWGLAGAASGIRLAENTDLVGDAHRTQPPQPAVWCWSSAARSSVGWLQVQYWLLRFHNSIGAMLSRVYHVHHLPDPVHFSLAGCLNSKNRFRQTM